MTKSYVLMELKSEHSDNILRLMFNPSRDAKFIVLTVTPSGYEHFEGSFFCLPDANGLIYRLIESLNG